MHCVDSAVLPDPQQQAAANQLLAEALFATVRRWLTVKEEV